MLGGHHDPGRLAAKMVIDPCISPKLICIPFPFFRTDCMSCELPQGWTTAQEDKEVRIG